MTKQATRRRMAQLRAELHAQPWAMDVRALGSLSAAIESGDIENVRATLSLGQEGAESLAKLVNGIAVIPVCGVLRDGMDWMVRYGYAASYQQIERDFKSAIGNSQIKGVLFYFDTPGGSAIGCKRVADLIFESRGEKPIRAYVQGMCGSAGFYMAAACDRIEATADSLVASVGTIYPHLEMSGLLKDLGYGATVFTNADSPKKGHGNTYEPLSEASKATLQRYVDSYGRPFIEDVARYRGASAEQVIANYGQGDALRADVAVNGGVIDGIVDGFQQSLDSISNAAGKGPSAKPQATPVVSGGITRSSTMNERIKAQLFALGMIDSLSASDEVCKAAMAGWFKARNQAAPADEAKVLEALQSPGIVATLEAIAAEPLKGEVGVGSIQAVHNAEQGEARLEQLNASAEIINAAVGYEAVTAKMVNDAAIKKQSPQAAMGEWKKVLAESEPPTPTNRVGNATEKGALQFQKDVVDALVSRAGNKVELSEGAEAHITKPLWAVAAECLNNMGIRVDMYAEREGIAEMAMATSTPGVRHPFYSSNENRKYIQASGSPASRPGDFPNILSAFANKYLDTIELDDDYSYEKISALLPGGMNDFKPGSLINKGIVEELDEVQDAEAFKELGLQEECLSYIFMRRFGNKFGWTPVLIANDDLNAFAEGMLGLAEAWQVTQNRLVLDLLMSNPTLLDGSALFANRTDIGSATNNNDRTSGAAPSDSEWGTMENQYADISGVGTGRRVRGHLNTILVPTGTQHQEAKRTFAPLNLMEPKVAATTATIGLYRGDVEIIPESELRGATVATRYYGMRSPTKLNTATLVRAYFNGFGQQGKRERWYDPENKTTWVSLEGRIATAIKNWRYIIRNKGAA